MVKGIEKFQKFFSDYTDSYIIIGGTACDIIEETAGFNPRATKDIDIILIVGALSREFGEQFWRFIQAGNYTTKQKSNGENEYYRFIKPRDIEFPVQIELFSKNPDIILFDDASSFTPIPLDEDLSSLSAILMNDDYYNFTLAHSFIFSSIRMANIESLICLKAKAFIDLTERKIKAIQLTIKTLISIKMIFSV